MIVHGIIEPGYQVASGNKKDGIYPEGTIKMQAPFFKERGVNIDDFYPATINVTIKPKTFTIIAPDYHLIAVEWTNLHPPENFIFIELEIRTTSKIGGKNSQFSQFSQLWQWRKGLLYYPDPATKKDHFTVPSRLEILTEYIDKVEYGDPVELRISDKKIIVKG